MRDFTISLHEEVTVTELEATYALFAGLTSTTKGLANKLCSQLSTYLSTYLDIIEDDDEILFLDSPENTAAMLRERFSSIVSETSAIRVRQARIKRALNIGHYTILAGSIIPVPKPSCSTSVKKLYTECIKEHIIDENTHKLLKDLEVNSPSLACSIVSGYNTNGVKILQSILWP